MVGEPESTSLIIRLVLTYRGMTMGELGESLGMSPQVMSQRMTGRSSFSFRELKEAAAILDVDPLVFFDEPINALNHFRPQDPDVDGPESDDLRSRSPFLPPSDLAAVV